MKCAVHPDVDATGFCRHCGKPLCPQCTRDVRGALYCEECLSNIVFNGPGTAPPARPGVGNPAAALVLGFIPGLGAVYNGEYAKALIHVCIFGGIIAVLNSDVPGSYDALFGVALACFYFYMPIDAFRVAKARATGQPVPEMIPMFGSMAGPRQGPVAGPAPGSASGSVPTTTSALVPGAASEQVPGNYADPATGPPHDHSIRHAMPEHAPVGPMILIGLGLLLLLANFGFFRWSWVGRLWPLGLVALGAWILFGRVKQGS
jgi:hypothetical protein